MAESHFDSVPGGSDPRVEDTEQYTPLLSVNKYRFMDDSFYGTGGFRDGSYLIPHTREMFYKTRKELTGYRNFMSPIVRALVEPVFTDAVPRVITDMNDNELGDDANHPFRTFIEDADSDGTSLHEFVEQATLDTRLHGVSFVVMDNYGADMQPATMQEAIDDRIMPYVYLKSAEEVVDWTNDTYGCLTTITFAEQPIKVTHQNGTVECQPRFRLWTEMYSQVLTKNKDGDFENVGPAVYHNLGQLPVIVTYVRKPRYRNEILVDPPMFDLARMCLVIYNKDSEIRDQERAQAFSCLYVQGEPNGNLTIGPHNVIFLPPDASIAPGFASPDSSILAGLVANNEELRKSLFQMAEQSGVVGTQIAESGVAARWHFWAVESQLKKTASIAQSIEYRIKDLYEAYMATEFGYTVTYPDDFQPGDVTAVINNYKTILDLRPPVVLAEEIWCKIGRIVMEDDDPDDIKEVIEEIEAEFEVVTSPESAGETGPQGETGMPEQNMQGMTGMPMPIPTNPNQEVED